MDHIPDADGIRLDTKFPYLCPHIHYDGQEWETFPARYGYPWLSFECLDVSIIDEYREYYTDEQLQAFVQAWMYFALLEIFLPDTHQRLDFVDSTDERRPIISTRKALQWEFSWSRRPGLAGFLKGLHPTSAVVEGQKDEPKYKHLQRRRDGHWKCKLNSDVTRVLARAIQASHIWDRYAKDKDSSWAELVLSIKLVIELLYSIPLWYEVDGIDKVALETHPGPAVDILRAHLLRSKSTWCLHQIDALCNKVSYSTLLYLTGIRRESRPGVDHAECFERSSCRQYNINAKEDFRAAHLEPDCDCDHVEAPNSERTQILQRGGIPVLSCNIQGSGHISLRFVPASPNLDYVAISHLWADGLGNPIGNSLPHCQLTNLINCIDEAQESYLTSRVETARPGLEDPFWRLKKAKRKLERKTRTSKHILLWLDVYCIPLGPYPERYPDPRSQVEKKLDLTLKRKAIARMDATYAWAQFVLAIDREVKSSTRTHDDLTRNLALIGISAWNSRCWTFQEHSVAKVTHFPAIDLDDIFKRSAYVAGIQRIREDLYSLFESREPFSWSQIDLRSLIEADLFEAWNSFHGRTTSQWDDMIAIFANLLEMNARTVLHLDTGSQMKGIFASQTQVPIAFLFADMKRLGNNNGKMILGERWVPASLQNVFLPHRLRSFDMDVLGDGLLLKGSVTRGNVVLLHVASLPLSRQPVVFRWRPNPKDRERHFWLSLDYDEALECRTDSSNEALENAFLVLDRTGGLFNRDHSTSFAGACLIRTKEDYGQHTPVAFVCSVRWGTLEDKIYENHGRDDAGPSSSNIMPVKRFCEFSNSIMAHTVPEDHPRLLIESDIATWPHLQSRRQRKSFTIYSRWTPHLFVTLPFFATLLCWPPLGIGAALISEPTPVVGIVLVTIGALLAAYAFLTRLFETALRYQLMYITHSELDVEEAWWRQLEMIFGTLRMGDLRYLDWVFVTVLKGVVFVVKVIMDGVITAVRHPMKRPKWSMRRGDRSEGSVDLEAHTTSAN